MRARRDERTQVTGDQDTHRLFADDVAPHGEWHAHAHPGRDPCYCWSRGDVVPGGEAHDIDGLGMRPQRRWLLMPVFSEWSLYDMLALNAGRKGPVARFPGTRRSEAARLADTFIAGAA